MGQYHIIVNLDEHEFLNPWDMGEGAKLMEWGYGSGTMLTALAILLAVSNGRGGGDFHGNEKDPTLDEWVGRWGGDRIAVIGDYAEDGDLEPEHHAGAIWHACSLAREGKWVPLKKRIAENEKSRASYGGDYVDEWNARDRLVESMPRFTNISAPMRLVIEADGVVHFTSEIWKSSDLDGTVTEDEHIRVKRSDDEGPSQMLRPDMVIG